MKTEQPATISENDDSFSCGNGSVSTEKASNVRKKRRRDGTDSPVAAMDDSVHSTESLTSFLFRMVLLVQYAPSRTNLLNALSWYSQQSGNDGSRFVEFVRAGLIANGVDQNTIAGPIDRFPAASANNILDRARAIQTVRQRLESAQQENDQQAVDFVDNAGLAEDSTSSLSDMSNTDSAASMAVSAGNSTDEHDLLDIMAQSDGPMAPAAATSATDRQGEDKDGGIQNRTRSHDLITESKKAGEKIEGCNPAKKRKTG